jgi:hypothetical protein
MKLLKGYIRLFVLTLTYFFTSIELSAQVDVKGKVLRADQNEAVPFCAIGIKSSNRGCLSNEDGDFLLRAANQDTLVFSAIGYKKVVVTVAQVLKQGTVLLQVSEMLLEEVTVISNNNFVYELLGKSRKALMNSISRNAKAYYFLETEISGQPVELLECYYTAKLNNNRIQDLGFKNGRIGVAPFVDRYFVSLDISKAFTMLNLIYPYERMPSNPYQFNTKQLKKNYFLHLSSSYDSLQPVYIIEFIAKNNEGHFFNGKVHVLKSNYLPLKIELRVQNTLHHPFRPLFPNSKISSASMQINKNFEFKNDSCYVHHIDFNYNLTYVVQNQTRIVKSKGLMYFYDYNKPFLPILYDYNSELDDYKKISGLSFNELFWKNNQVIEYTKALEGKRNFLEQNGFLLNYKNQMKLAPGVKKENFFESNDILWSKEKRIFLRADNAVSDSSRIIVWLSNDTTIIWSERDHFRINNYSLKSGIYLDANPIHDSIQHYSVSIFKVNESYYHLKEDANTNSFLNIYFDLLEIERRKMEKEIEKNPNSWAHIKACYTKAQTEFENTSLRYFKEVERGTNKKRLEVWNQKVVDELSINNIEIFNILAR